MLLTGPVAFLLTAPLILMFDGAAVVVTTVLAALACVLLWCLAPLRRRRAVTARSRVKA